MISNLAESNSTKSTSSYNAFTKHRNHRGNGCADVDASSFVFEDARELLGPLAGKQDLV